MGARLSALMPVASREVRPCPSRPGSFFLNLKVHSSARLVPSVCASISGRGFFIGFVLLFYCRLHHADRDKARGSQTLDDNLHHLRRRLKDALLDNGFELVRISSMAVALDFQPNHSIVDADQFGFCPLLV